MHSGCDVCSLTLRLFLSNCFALIFVKTVPVWCDFKKIFPTLRRVWKKIIKNLSQNNKIGALVDICEINAACFTAGLSSFKDKMLLRTI
jgi:hypothetical protein